MAITNTATNFNGTLDEFLYLVLGLGNDVTEKGAAHLITDIAYMKQLDHLVTAEDPFEDYTDDDPTFGNATTKDKRDLEPKKMTISGTITPSAWLAVWKKYRSEGTLTELRANAAFLQDVIMLVKNSANRQLAKLFWQGDVAAGGASPLRFFDGIIKQVEADGTVVNVTPAGIITQANVFDIIAACYKVIPDKFIEDPDYKLHMSTADFRLLQLANNDVNKTTNGVLDKEIKRLFLEQRIEHFQSLPKDRIVGAHSSNAEDSNLLLGMYFDVDAEFSNIRVDWLTKFSKKVGYRVEIMAVAQYRYVADILYYKPS